MTRGSSDKVDLMTEIDAQSKAKRKADAIAAAAATQDLSISQKKAKACQLACGSASSMIIGTVPRQKNYSSVAQPTKEGARLHSATYRKASKSQ